MVPDIAVGSDETSTAKVLHPRQPHGLHTKILTSIDCLDVFFRNSYHCWGADECPNLKSFAVSLMQLVQVGDDDVHFHLKVKPSERLQRSMRSRATAAIGSSSRRPVTLASKQAVNGE